MRVQATAQNAPTGNGAAASGSADEFAKALASFTSAQKAAVDKEAKKTTLSFVVKGRTREVGLECVLDDMVPSEESLLRLEAASRPARDQGRLCVGSADGEVLMANFRPFWSRTPKLGVCVGDGSMEEKLRAALGAKEARTAEEKTC